MRFESSGPKDLFLLGFVIGGLFGVILGVFFLSLSTGIAGAVFGGVFGIFFFRYIGRNGDVWVLVSGVLGGSFGGGIGAIAVFVFLSANPETDMDALWKVATYVKELFLIILILPPLVAIALP